MFVIIVKFNVLEKINTLPNNERFMLKEIALYI